MPGRGMQLRVKTNSHLSMARQGLRAFSADGSQYLSISKDNRIVLWNVASGKIAHTFDDPGHLDRGYTCMAWTGHLIALGSKDASIFIWNTKTGELACTLAGDLEGHVGKITALEFNASGSTLFSAAADRHVIEWSVDSKSVSSKWKIGRKPVSAIALSPNGSVLATASSTIVLWDVASKSQIGKLTGHSSKIVSIQFSTCGSYLASCALNEYFTSLCKVDISNKGEPVASLLKGSQISTESTIVRPSDLASGLLCVLTKGQASLYDMEAAVLSTEPSEPASVVSTPPKERLLSVHFVSRTSLLVARGTVAAPIFFQTDIKNGEENTLKSVELKSLEEDVSESSKKRKDSPAQVIESTVNRNVKQKVAVSNDGAAAAAKMKELVEKDGNGKVTASSMQRLLVQALHTNDKASLEYCFQVCDEDIIGNTVDRIPPAFVLKLLEHIITRMEHKPSRSILLLPWLNEVLRRHAAHLINIPDLIRSKLASLYQSIETRLATFGRFIELDGRMDMIFSQVKLREQPRPVEAQQTVDIE